MAVLSNESSASEPRTLPPPPSSSTSKISQVLRRGSTVDSNEKRKEKDTRRPSILEPERKSSLASLPLRLRRRKTQPVVEHSEEEVEAAERLGRLFFSLPSEIVSQIITHLSLNDIYTLRLSSRTFNTILNYNTLAVTRSILPQCLPDLTTPHIQTHLYPATTRTPNLSDLLTTLRRQHLLTRQINNLLAFVQMKSYMTRTATRVLSVSDNRLRLTHAFTRPAWFLTHFLEAYRHAVIHLHPSHPPHPAHTTGPTSPISICPQCLTHLHGIISSYPDADVLPTYHLHLLSMEHLQIATRAPSAAGPLERRLRGWRKLSTADENVNLAIFVVFGGMGPLGRVAMMQGSYASRVAVMGDFVDRVWGAVAENERRGGVGSGDGSEGVGGGVAGEGNSNVIVDTLEPPWAELTRSHVASLPVVSTFFYDVWKERIEECAVEGEDVHDSYSWLQKAMEGSGLAFGQLRIPEPPLALGASPL